MKEITCKDVRVPGCDEQIRGQSEQEVVQKAIEHVKQAHGLTDVTPDIPRKARKGIHDV